MTRLANLTSALAAAALLAMAAQPAVAQLAQQPAPDNPQAAAAWRSLLDADLTDLREVVQRNYIYAVYPGGSAWNDRLDRALARARRETAQVKDFGGYRAVLQHFIVSFGDAHFSAYFTVASRQTRWPGFSLTYRAGRYVVAASQVADARPGDQVSACDGRSLDAWMDGLAEFYGGPKGRETTRAAIADQFLLDRGNPLVTLPRICRVGQRDVALTWRPAPLMADPMRTSGAPVTLADHGLAISDFGRNGAWVRIGTMGPETQAQAGQFRALIAAAPTLRDKDVIVIDVRGNPGGPYDWFMAFLRGLYGQPYADHYARARLEIANVIYTPPDAGGTGDAGFAGEAGAIKAPPDPPLVAALARPRVTTLPNGGRLAFLEPPVKSIAYPATPPADPVRARVYVLADYACASACIAFADEMMRFPGVTLIGTETHVDMRSGGWPGGFELPSGLAVVRMGRMVREGRARGDNEAWAPGPENRFPGDIADTAAVKSWILGVILPRDAAPGATWRQTASLKGPDR